MMVTIRKYDGDRRWSIFIAEGPRVGQRIGGKYRTKADARAYCQLSALFEHRP